MRDSFSTFHPLVSFTYFALVLSFGMIFLHPLTLAAGLVGSLSYALYLNRGNVGFSLAWLIPMFIITALLNPVFNHRGMTILTYLPGGNPLTMESILYGVAAAVMLVTVLAWFICFNRVVTSDKLIYLFGRVIPSLSLLFSMSLRLAPRFRAQIKVISEAQKCLGRDVSQGKLLNRCRHGIRILSIMVSWALENAIETADSMKSRGYGLKGRTAFSLYHWERRDSLTLAIILLSSAYIMIGARLGGLDNSYFPTIRFAASEPLSISLYLVYTALCLLPLAINLLEDLRWRALKSTI